MNNKCYILSAEQVTCQNPLSNDWFDNPIMYEDNHVFSIEPDHKKYIKPAEARRMSKILRRAICTSFAALEKSGIDMPDAIVTGTGMGCIENSEKFLIDMSKYGESLLKPTLFMQSTHNTISSMIAILMGCHGYNNTYSHREISFDSALLDAWLQIKTGAINTALTGSHDELTPLVSKVLNHNMSTHKLLSEVSVSMVLSNRDSGAICELESIHLVSKPSFDEIKNISNIKEESVIMTGINHNLSNDSYYLELMRHLNARCYLEYKPIFGDGSSSSAAGVYAASVIMRYQKIPRFMIADGSTHPPESVGEIFFINRSDNGALSIIKLKRI